MSLQRSVREGLETTRAFRPSRIADAIAPEGWRTPRRFAFSGVCRPCVSVVECGAFRRFSRPARQWHCMFNSTRTSFSCALQSRTFPFAGGLKDARLAWPARRSQTRHHCCRSASVPDAAACECRFVSTLQRGSANPHCCAHDGRTPSRFREPPRDSILQPSIASPSRPIVRKPATAQSWRRRPRRRVAAAFRRQVHKTHRDGA